MDALEVCRWRNVSRRLYCAVVFLLATATLCAQPPQGEIRLQVKDPSGAPMQATGKLENRAAGVTRDFQTDAQGMVVMGHLPFGRYRLQVSKSGFTTQAVTVDVRSAAPATRSISMEIGAESARV